MIPRLAAAAQQGPAVTLSDGCVIDCDPGAWQVGVQLRSWLQDPTGWQVTLAGQATPILATPSRAGQGTGNLIRLRLDDQVLAEEGYQLATGGGAVTITARTAAGLFYGVQTLRLLLPPKFLRSARAEKHGAAVPVNVPGMQIDDRPRLSWRGVHLDVARHLMPKNWVLRLIDLIALHKLNVLHLHLTDDQGWRVEIERYPRLTQVGAWRRESPLGHARERRFDGIPHGGYYTKEDLREIAEYAARQFVTVVPEIDMPGHMQAAVAAYPRLGNSASAGGEPAEVWHSWGISPRVLNLDDETLRFCRDVLDEVIDTFPGPYVHLGGDECPTREWEDSAAAQQRMASLSLADERHLQGWFTGQVAAHVTARGRVPVLWDDALEAGAPPEAVIMSWRGELAGWYAASAGYDVVMAPQYWTYLDWAQAPGGAEPLAIHPTSTTSLRRVHAFDPAPAHLSAAAREHVVGAQCQLWTEYVPDTARAEYMYFPRVCALAEVAWSPPAALAPGAAYDDFRQRLTGHLARLDALGVNYRPPDGPTPGQARSWPEPDARADA